LKDIQDLMPVIEDCAIEPSQWTSLLETLCSYTDSKSAVIIPLKGRYPSLIKTESANELMSVYFEKNWHLRDFRDRGVPSLLRKGIMVDQDFASIDEINKNPYYQDFLGPLGLRFFAGIRVTADDDAWCITLQRSIEKSYFDVDEQKTIAQFVRPLSKAVQVGRSISAAYVKGCLDSLDVSSTACVLLDRLDRVKFVSNGAEKLFGSLFNVVSGHLRLGDARQDMRFNAYLNNELRGRFPSAQPFCYNTDEHLALIEVSRLPSAFINRFSTFQTMVTIKFVNANLRVDRGLLETLFALTPRESELVEALCRMSALPKAAEHIGIAYETARTHLKTIFFKMRIASQSELIALVSKCTPTRQSKEGVKS